MRPNHRWAVLRVFILAGMLLTLKADRKLLSFGRIVQSQYLCSVASPSSAGLTCV